MGVTKKYKILDFEDRLQIERFLNKGISPQKIAYMLGVSQSTVYRELQRGDTGEMNDDYQRIYSAELGERNFKENMSKRGRLGYRAKRECLNKSNR